MSTVFNEMLINSIGVNSVFNEMLINSIGLMLTHTQIPFNKKQKTFRPPHPPPPSDSSLYSNLGVFKNQECYCIAPNLKGEGRDNLKGRYGANLTLNLEPPPPGRDPHPLNVFCFLFIGICASLYLLIVINY